MTKKMKTKDPMPITVHFAVGIRSDGELIRVKITQGVSEILLTDAQMETLWKEFARKVKQ